MKNEPSRALGSQEGDRLGCGWVWSDPPGDEVGEWCRGGRRGSCRPGLLGERGAGGTVDAGRELGGPGEERQRAGGRETIPLSHSF